MKAKDVPGLSIALVEDQKIVWPKASVTPTAHDACRRAAPTLYSAGDCPCSSLLPRCCSSADQERLISTSR